MAGNSEKRKCAKKGSSRLPEVLVNNVYFCWEKGAATKGRQRREGGIFLEEGLQLFPGRLGKDVREVELGKLSSAHRQALVLLHLVEFLVKLVLVVQRYK